jgi:hypothetical protein
MNKRINQQTSHGMLKAYIILAHKDLDQVLQLLKRLDEQSAFFFVHIDKKVPPEELFVFSEFSGKLYMVERIRTEWAEFNLVKATLNAMKALQQTGKNFEMISLLSGKDYPVKSNEYIEAFYKTTGKRVFIEHYPLPNYVKWKHGGGMYRVNKYFFGLKLHQRYAAKTVNLLSALLPFLQRKLPGKLVPYGGSQWWTMDQYAIDYILDFVKEHPAYSTFHRYTFAPDEVFFQTILLNATDERLLNSMQNNNKRYLQWKEAGASHPEVLNLTALPALLASDAFFARKFELHRDPEILDQINHACLKQPAGNLAVSGSESKR